ncbi:thiol-activated cytolysin family protein [Capnocytophaga periodontitidis]|uniref:thiol-activated cytolysin family protein n=1 Tax=Capnocytophaga periodontitidis TaxID=2795027 RepID=UPI0018E1CF07|nr:thiol-activated cytolysin family protein [Capnocytophaga periodontitidis]MBI1667951.1 thiol-activated cytolysin family protein [Capnocytophaga periodontitidis]
MKLSNLKTLSFIAVAMCMMSCDNDESFSDQLAGLKSVTFPEQQEQVITSKETGRLIGNKVEVVETVRKQQTLDPVQIVDATNLETIYPGSVLNGEAFLEGEYTNLKINNPKEITLSTTLKGSGAVVKAIAIPTPSDVKEKVNTLVSQKAEKVDYNNVASYMSYVSNEVTTQESFTKTLGIHVKVEVLKGLAKGSFGYEQKELNINTKKHILIKVRQLFYNVSIDPKSANEWGDIQIIGNYEPVYISSVDYGRVATLLVETDESISEVTKKIEASISVGLAKVGLTASASSLEEQRNYFKKSNIVILLAGGPLSSAKSVRDYDSFVDFLLKPNSESLVKGAVPIGYKVRSLKDNREVTVRTMFTEQRFNYK